MAVGRCVRSRVGVRHRLLARLLVASTSEAREGLVVVELRDRLLSDRMGSSLQILGYLSSIVHILRGRNSLDGAQIVLASPSSRHKLVVLRIVVQRMYNKLLTL